MAGCGEVMGSVLTGLTTPLTASSKVWREAMLEQKIAAALQFLSELHRVLSLTAPMQILRSNVVAP